MTRIEWTDQTWNLVVGCTPVSAGCANCYAARFASRFSAVWPGVSARGKWTRKVLLRPDTLDVPLHWRKPRRVFVCSMSDLFHPDVPFGYIDRVYAVMALCPQHTFQVLTKRPERMAEYLAGSGAIDDSGRSERMPRWYRHVTEWLDEGASGRLGRNWDRCHEAAGRLDGGPLHNVWHGTSAEDQETLEARIGHLRRCPGRRFLSLEPLLGQIRFDVVPGNSFPGCTRHDCLNGRLHHDDDGGKWTTAARIDWLIIGGESGPGARPCDVAWIRDLVRQGQAANVPVFVKQLGAKPYTCIGHECAPACNCGRRHDCRGNADDDWCHHIKIAHPKGGDPAEWPEDLRVREWPELTADR